MASIFIIQEICHEITKVLNYVNLSLALSLVRRGLGEVNYMINKFIVILFKINIKLVLDKIKKPLQRNKLTSFTMAL